MCRDTVDISCCTYADGPGITDIAQQILSSIPTESLSRIKNGCDFCPDWQDEGNNAWHVVRQSDDPMLARLDWHVLANYAKHHHNA
jgi:hypothetical protein